MLRSLSRSSVRRSVGARCLATLRTATLESSAGCTLRATGLCARLKIHSNMDTDLVQISSDRECDLISSDRECDLSALARVDERGDVHVHGTDGAAELTIGVPAAYEIDVSTRDHCHVEVGG